MDVLDDEFKVTTHYLLINSAQLVKLYHMMKSKSKTNQTNGIIEMLYLWENQFFLTKTQKFRNKENNFMDKMLILSLFGNPNGEMARQAA